MSLAVQGLANVARDEILDGPCSVNVMTIAESGERKTSVDKVFSFGARRFERKKLEEYREKIKVYRADCEAHEELKKGLKDKIKKAGTPEEKEKKQAELAEHAINAPTQPVKPVLFYQDTTVQALGKSLAESFILHQQDLFGLREVNVA
jgi:putative DNA primase/helicase